MTNFKVGEIDVDLGIGYGLTPALTGLRYAFPRAWEGQEIRDRTEDTFGHLLVAASAIRQPESVEPTGRRAVIGP